MSNTSCENETLDCLIRSWAAKIASSSGTSVEAIIAISENVRDALHELEPYGRKARQLLAQHSGLSRPMMSKLETIGRRAVLLRRMAATLPPSLSSLYALARKPEPIFEQALMLDLRAKSRAEINALFAPLLPAKPTRKLMTILVPPDLNEAARRVLIADIGVALARIMDSRRVDLDISLPAGCVKSMTHDAGNEPVLCLQEEAEQPDSRGDDRDHGARDGQSSFFTGEKTGKPDHAPA